MDIKLIITNSFITNINLIILVLGIFIEFILHNFVYKISIIHC